MSTRQYILIQRELFIKHGIREIAYNNTSLFNSICKEIKCIQVHTSNIEDFRQLVEGYLETINNRG